VMPFFALLSIYSIWRVWKYKEFKWLIVLGISYAFVLQSHYLGLLLAPTLFIFWFLAFRNLKLIKNFTKSSLIGLAFFVFLMSPLVIFDARHGWRNFAATKKFFLARQETVSIRPWNAIPKFYPIFEKVNSRLLAGRNVTAGKAISIIMVAWLIWLFLFGRKSIIHNSSFMVLALWFFFALLGLGLYKQEIYDHYYGFFFPAPFLLVGALAEGLAKSGKRISGVVLFIVLSSLFIVNLQNSPLKYPPNQQLRRAKEVAQKIAEESGGRKFNLAVIAERNYEDGYQYFLEMWQKPIVEIDAQKPETTADQLFVVCEIPKEKCDPTHSPKAEVANFGWSRISDQWTVNGVQLYKLVHTKKL